ncbi:MAG: ABC transporter permease subunit [Spirochaetota bacterium]
MKNRLMALFSIQGRLGRVTSYVLYTVYALLAIALWQMNLGTAIRPFAEIFASLKVLWLEKGLAVDIGQSIRLNVVAICTSLVLTLVICYAAVFPIFRPIAFVISKGRFFGLLGLNFIFIEVFGLGFGLKLSLLAFGMSVFYITSMYTIITEIPQEKFDYARALGLSKIQILWHVMVRGTAAEMLEALRQNAAIAWMMITAVEGIVRAGGIGDRLWSSNKHFARGEVLAILFCILTIGVIQDILLKGMAKAFAPHTEKEGNR